MYPKPRVRLGWVFLLTGSLGSTSLKTSFWTIFLSWKKYPQSVVENGWTPRINWVRQVLVICVNGPRSGAIHAKGMDYYGASFGSRLIGNTVS